jgi:hypothetical protein
MPHLTTSETRRLGVVLELNRRLLHPRGLALEIVVDPEQPDAIAALRIQDHRIDLDGVYFGDLDEDDVAKARRFNELADAIAATRLAELGYLVQPLELVTEPGP